MFDSLVVVVVIARANSILDPESASVSLHMNNPMARHDVPCKELQMMK